MNSTTKRLNSTISRLAVASAQRIWEFYSANKVFVMFLDLELVVFLSAQSSVSVRSQNREKFKQFRLAASAYEEFRVPLLKWRPNLVPLASLQSPPTATAFARSEIVISAPGF